MRSRALRPPVAPSSIQSLACASSLPAHLRWSLPRIGVGPDALRRQHTCGRRHRPLFEPKSCGTHGDMLCSVCSHRAYSMFPETLYALDPSTEAGRVHRTVHGRWMRCVEKKGNIHTSRRCEHRKYFCSLRGSFGMLQGARAALHKGTVVYVSELTTHPVRATIQSHDATSGKWQVRLHGSQFQGRELLVPEEALRVSFCLMPQSLSMLQTFVRLSEEMTQGSCGRGLVLQEHVRAGDPIFAEPPFIVIGALVLPHRTHHSERWLAYSALKNFVKEELQQAHAGRHTTLEYTQALQAFNDLGMASHVPSHLRETAEHIASKMFGDPSKAGEVTDVLMKFHSNQFRLDNGSEPMDKEFAASGVYKFISRVNHSCAPSMAIVPARVYAKQRGSGVGESVEESGGVLLAHAIRDLLPGERLTFCYGPAELAQHWDLQKRREYLRAELGFTCNCERCAAEEAGEIWEPPKGVSTPATTEAEPVPGTEPAEAVEAEVEALWLEDWQIAELQKRAAAAQLAGQIEEVAEVDVAEVVEEVEELKCVEPYEKEAAKADAPSKRTATPSPAVARADQDLDTPCRPAAMAAAHLAAKPPQPSMDHTSKPCEDYQMKPSRDMTARGAMIGAIAIAAAAVMIGVAVAGRRARQ